MEAFMLNKNYPMHDMNKVFDMFRIENGKLAEHWDCVMHNIDDTNTASGHSQF